MVTIISPNEPSSNITIDHNHFTNPIGGGVFISQNQKNVKITNDILENISKMSVTTGSL